MENLVAPILNFLESLATSVSLEAFVVIGAFLEELLAPIPSPFVMTTAAVLAQVQGYNVFQLGILVVFAAVAKTASSYVVYVVADKAEDVIIGKFGKYFGISHRHIERIGKMLTGSWWDDVLLFFARAIPIVPTFPVSVGAGVIKYSVRSYVLMTFLGTAVRSIFYLWIAYFGWTQFQALRFQLWEHPVWLVLGVLVGAVLLVLILRTKETIWERFLSRVTSVKK